MSEEKVLNIKNKKGIETEKGFAYTIAFYMELRVNLPMQPPKTLMVPESMDIVFSTKINSPIMVTDTIIQMKEEEFLKRKLSSPDFGERRILSIKLFNIFFWGQVELEKKREVIN